ncbi:unnamed protein product [Pleuronectes platessa]|uniref:Uncharacterized protein n=1 Tax=Pleuronectes platessa TaxID=8262 RepID=A0A9N7UZ75_PLEPL|nr:unnamed protein product [Pleuronectes platessa]
MGKKTGGDERTRKALSPVFTPIRCAATLIQAVPQCTFHRPQQRSEGGGGWGQRLEECPCLDGGLVNISPWPVEWGAEEGPPHTDCKSPSSLMHEPAGETAEAKERARGESEGARADGGIG